MKVYSSATLFLLCMVQQCEMLYSFVVVPTTNTILKSDTVLYSSYPTTSQSSERSSWSINSMLNVMRVEGGSRRTWDFGDLTKETVQVVMESNGRPVGADIQVWIGPDWTPFKVKTYSEDGQLRPVQALVGTRSKAAQIEVRNTYSMEYPFSASCEYAKQPQNSLRKVIPTLLTPKYVEGGAVYNVPFDATANQIQVLLETDSRQLSAKVELLNGPNNVKQYFEAFTNNGQLNSFYVLFNTPGTGNTIRIHNQNTLEFPFRAYVSAV